MIIKNACGKFWQYPESLILFIILIVTLAGCAAARPPAPQRLDLPGRLVIYRDGQYFQYTPTGPDPFISAPRIPDQYELDYDPSRSPDGQWRLTYDGQAHRFILVNGPTRIYFPYFVLSPSQIAWSPDSRYIAFRADDDQSRWQQRIMVIALPQGASFYLGQGESPRWYSATPNTKNVQ